MENSFEINVDFNGIVIFNEKLLNQVFGSKIPNDYNLLKDLTETDFGEKVLNNGAVIPILGLDDGNYFVRFFMNLNPNLNNRKVIFSDKFYYLNVSSDIYVADIAVFWDWENYLGWEKVNIPYGKYKVTVEGVHLIDKNETRYGFDIILSEYEECDYITEPRSDSRL
ncbi:hypothetical protein G9F32_16485 [Acinetobacter sp. 194]|uniref:hypothetical protein n=1 Tax=Acinetobacter shaoyimingii TaxID=2715164 RepID=UPI001409A82E|nr:hypothetical protein [Acinetobacter shaoyimingii]NHB59591.1 hypothetical protein [Acinetobacter shaoyimingii]